MVEDDQIVERKGRVLLPSAFMRKLRPENYSDTEARSAYLLDKDVFDHRLETITNRNETHDFEIFCRKLCGRTICPNLRPQTGPEGGGDSKVDTESLPQSDELANLPYVGEANGGRERWAFAFSAKKRWAEKVRNDVAGIVATGRPYQRILCVTARYAPAKTRAALEDELTKRHGVPVTVFDRSWIIEKVIDEDRKDLAYNYLNAGHLVTDSHRLGPADYSRSQQLMDIERQLGDPTAYEKMERQRVTEALVAAKLSREIERPRTDTEGRFARAIRLADADGSHRQRLEARYETIWTAFWWFDDVASVNALYTAFEALALPDDNSRNVEFLATVLQLLFNAVLTGLLSPEDCDLNKRAASLAERLTVLADDNERPNNSLEARVLLLHLRLNQALVARDEAAISAAWPELSGVLEKAKGLGEFAATRLVKLIEVLGSVAGSDPRYDALVEEAAAFVSERTSEGEGALILLRRAKQLDLAKHFDMIRLLGRAAKQLTKKEYADQLIEAQQWLCKAYYSTGLLWAARASSSVVMGRLAIESEEESQIRVDLVPAVMVWAWLSLEMRHLPDLLEAVQLANGMAKALPLTNDSRERLNDGLRELDLAFGSYVLNFSDAELGLATRLVSVLGCLGLTTSQIALLYVLGYRDELASDGSLPEGEPIQRLDEMLAALASQPISADPYGPLIVNGPGRQTYSSTILGMRIEVEFEGTIASILLAETLLGSIEAFFATVLEMDVHPHAERVWIGIVEDPVAAEPRFSFDPQVMAGQLTWPSIWSTTASEHQEPAQLAYLEAAGVIMAAAFLAKDPLATIETLASDDAVMERIALVAFAANSRHRFLRGFVSRLSDKEALAPSDHPIRPDRPVVERRPFDRDDAKPSRGRAPREFPKFTETGRPRYSGSHRGITVRSVIDYHLWNEAGWKGAAYIWPAEGVQPPTLALLFEERGPAEKIFDRWRDRFGKADEKDEIYIAVVRAVSASRPNDYNMLITSRLPKPDESSKDGIITTQRILPMHPTSSANLDGFLSRYKATGVYALAPAIVRPGETPDILWNHALLKRQISVRDAADVSANDVEQIAVKAVEPPPGFQPP